MKTKNLIHSLRRLGSVAAVISLTPLAMAQEQAAAEAVATKPAETHQKTKDADKTLTTNHGLPVSDNQNQLKAGMRGPVLLEDFIFREKIQHFDHERIPERVVHARGSGAHGYFQCYE